MNSQFADQLPDTWKRATQFFSALGDPYRQKILLIFGSHEELCVNQIAALFKLSRPAISHHLKILRDASLLQCEKRGKEVYYRVNYDHCLDVFLSAARYVADQRDNCEAETAGDKRIQHERDQDIYSEDYLPPRVAAADNILG